MLFRQVHQGEGSRPVGRTLFTSKQNHLSLPKFLRGVISPAHFISIDQSLQISGNEENWSVVKCGSRSRSGRGSGLPSSNHARCRETDRSNVLPHASIGIRSARLVSSANYSIQSRWEPLRAASIREEEATTKTVTVRRSSRQAG